MCGGSTTARAGFRSRSRWIQPPSYGIGDVGDLDGDGDWDLFTAAALGGANRILLNGNRPEIRTADERGLPYKPEPTAGAANFVDSGQRLGGSESLAVALGDLDGDGDLDAAVANYGQGIDRIWLNDGAANFTKGMELGRGSSTHSVALGDLDGDGDLDLVFSERNATDRVFLNDGAASFRQVGDGFAPGISRHTSLGDLNGDGILDAVVSTGGSGTSSANTALFGDGKGGFNYTGLILGVDASWESALADLDGDGDLDIVFAAGDDRGELADAPNTVWLNDMISPFKKAGEPFSPGLSRGIDFGDLDGDGDLDAVVGNDKGALSGVWLNDGNLNFVHQPPYFGGFDRQPVLADFDGDGDLDAVLPSDGEETPNALWVNGGKADFTLQQHFGEPGGNFALDAGDLDGDGDWDLFLPRDGANEIWLNDTR